MENQSEVGPVVRGIRFAENVLGVIAGVTLLALMFLGSADVVGRYLFNRPITGALEISGIMMGGMVFLAWAYTMAKRAHVTVDIFFALYPPRLRATLTFVMMLISVILFALVVWQSTLTAVSDWQSGKLVRIILVPIAPFKLLVPLGALFLGLECLVQMVQSVHKMVGRRESSS